MIDVNFIPPDRRAARRQHLRLRAWVNGGLVYLGLLAAACVTIAILCWSIDASQVQVELKRVGERIDASGDEVLELRRRVQEARDALSLSQRVTRQPDWSVLLALLADAMDEEIVLARCLVQPGSAEGGRPAAGAEAGDALVVRVRGFGLSQQAVSRFVLRLEDARLFDTITLTESRREPFRNGQAVAFEIVCRFDGRREMHDG